MMSKIKSLPRFAVSLFIDSVFDISAIFNQGRIIGKNRRERFALLFYYIKINSLFLFGKIFKFRHNISNSVKIFDYNIKFFNYEELRLLFREIFVQQTYYFQTDKNNPFIIDCGANIGLSMLFFKTLYPNSKILGFEPNKETFEILENNIKANNVKDVKLINAAVYNREGTLSFYIDKKNDKTSVYNTVDKKWLNDTGNQAQEILVDCVKLSDFIKGKVDFFKIDIEGAEYEVFPEIESKLNMINRIVIEYHCSGADTVNGPHALLNILISKKFNYFIEGFVKPPYSVIENKSYGGIIYAYRNKGEK